MLWTGTHSFRIPGAVESRDHHQLVDCQPRGSHYDDNVDIA